jgi:4-amino-4-deoxy-L-arabinose transferase-like glycosyltransferase
MPRRERRWLIAAIVVSVAARLCLAGVSWLVRHDLAAFHTPDSLRYLLLGASLAAGDGYTLDGVPELFRVPGLPALIAILSRIVEPTAGTVTVQALLGAATTWLCFLAGQRISGIRAGLCAAWLYALEPGQWVWSDMVMTETLFTFCITAMLVAAIGYLQTGRRWALLVAVTAACAGAYVRMIGYMLAPIAIVACGLLVFRARRRSRRDAWADAAVAVVLSVTLLGAWHLRNGYRTGYWGFSTQFERAVYFVGGGSLQAQRGGTYGEAVAGLRRGIEAGGGRTPAQIASEMRRSGFAKVAQQPAAFVATYAAGIATTLLHPGAGAAIRLLRPPDNEASPSVTQMITLGRWHDARRLAAQKGSAYWILFVPLLALTIL